MLKNLLQSHHPEQRKENKLITILFFCFYVLKFYLIWLFKFAGFIIICFQRFFKFSSEFLNVRILSCFDEKYHLDKNKSEDTFMVFFELSFRIIYQNAIVYISSKPESSNYNESIPIYHLKE